MTGDLVLRGSMVVPAHELHWTFSRASGPGGQGVNTTDSRVQLTFDLGATPSIPPLLRDRAVRRLGGRLVDGRLTVTAAEERSQLLNREAALRRMARMLDEALAPPAPPRRATKPTRAGRERRLRGKRQRAEVKRLRRDPHGD